MSKRRFAALALSVTVAGAITTLPAGAQEVKTPEKFQGAATSTALELNVFGNPLTLGFTKVAGDSTVKAVAEGAGQLLDGETLKAEASSPGQKQDPDESCAVALPAEVPALDLELACADVVAETPGSLPHAKSNAAVGRLTLSANQLFENSPLKEVKEGTTQLTPLFEGLAEVFSQFEGTPIEEVPATLQELLADVLNTDTLAIQVGPSASEVTSTAKNIVSTATAQGAVIEVLPNAVKLPNEETGNPLLTIEVGAVKTTATRDRAANKNEAGFDPALVRATLDETIATGLGIPAGNNVIEVRPGQEQCLLADTPLESCIGIAAGSVTEGEGGSVKAVADAVSLHLLKGLPEAGDAAGIKLALAHAESEISGAPQVTVQAAPPAVPQELPRTGGPDYLPWIGAGLLGLAVALRLLVTRRA